MRPTAVVAAAVTLLAAGCGTRLPPSAFTSAGGDGAGSGSLVAPGTATAGTRAPSPGASAGAGLPGATGATTPGSAGSGATAPGRGAPGNTASDIGVTPTSITLGLIASRSNPFDPTAFVGPQYGAQAFFDDLNRRGGVHGRTVRLVTCDDHADGGQNNACVHNLIDTQKVFALVSQAIFAYAGAPYVQSKGVPDVGSQPISTAYDQYSHLFDIYGETYPRNGTVGYNGHLDGGTEVYRFFSQRFPNVPKKAGVVYYNQADSQRYADNLTKGLQAEGYAVVQKQINFALPDFNSAVLDMKAQGVQYVYDALDTGGNQNLCNAMDANGLSQQITAKVTTTQSWTAAIGSQYSSAPACRNKIWATGNTRNYEDTQYAGVRAFRAAMARLHTDGPTQMSEWALEGWAGAQWLTDAIGSCGAAVTRRCVEAYLLRPTPYDGHGLLTPRDFVARPEQPTSRNCINVARWSDSAQGGRGGWVTQVPDMDRNCFVVPNVPYTP